MAQKPITPEEQSRREAARDASPLNHEQAAHSLGLPSSTYKSWVRRNPPGPLPPPPEAKILFLDIETRPAVAYVWRLFDENVGIEQIVDPGGTICFGAKWFGERSVKLFSDWEHGHEAMIRAAHELISEADAVVTYNGDKFDLPKLRGEFITTGLPPPPPTTSIDVYKTVKQFGLLSNKLAFVGPLLTGDDKIKHEGFRLWANVNAREPSALKKMERYCAQDVKLLERVYCQVRPYIKNHPHMAMTGAHQCGACGSHRTQIGKPRRTKASFIHSVHCQACGSWQDGKRVAVR